MATTSLARSSLKTLTKYDSLLVGNDAYSPSEFISIATVNATGTTATFSSIPSTYKSLQIRWMIKDASGNTPFIRFNGDSSSVYTTHSMDGASSYYAQAQTGASSGFINYWGTSTGSNTFTVGITDIVDYADTSKFKTVKTFTGYDENGSGAVSLTSNLWRSTAAITSLVITCPAGYASGSTLALYGMKV